MFRPRLPAFRTGSIATLALFLAAACGGTAPRPTTTAAPTATAAPVITVAPTATAAPTSSPSPKPQATAVGLPPDGTWQVHLTDAELVAAGWPSEIIQAGTFTWTFADGIATFEIAGDDGSSVHCEADMTLVSGYVDLDYERNGGDCETEEDVVTWELADDGLHLFLISTTAPFDKNKAYLETKPWQSV